MSRYCISLTNRCIARDRFHDPVEPDRGLSSRMRASSPILRSGMLGIAVLVVSCSGGGDEQVNIAGHVFDGSVENAIVCMDLDSDGHCGANEPRSRTGADGAYELQVPKDSPAPLVAEVTAGSSRDADLPGQLVQASFRMASPAYAYSTDITPYTTLVHLSGERNFALAEDIVRDVLGLPSRFGLTIGPAVSPTSLARTVAGWVVTSLQTTDATLDWTLPGALGRLADALPPALTTLPTLAITTKDNAPIVSKEDYVNATYELTHPAAATPTVKLNGKIRGRGHSTWGLPKNPYKVQFSNDPLYAALGDVLGMKKNRNWALLADYFDRSLMRNKLAFALGNSAVFNDGLKWTPTGLHVEVTLNGDYIGVYLLTEDIRIDVNRLNIKKMSSSAAVGEVDGGYIVEADWRLDCYNEGDLNLQYVSPLLGTHLCVDTPDEGSITQPQLAYIKDLLGSVERGLVSSAAIPRLNPISWADWYLLQEVFRNSDSVFFSSVFLWKDTDAAADPADRLLNLGPIWDFDISAGNVNWLGNWISTGCWVNKPNGGVNWLTPIFNNPAFVELTTSRWMQKRPELERFINTSLDTYARRLQAAQERNFARWPILGVPLTNYYTWQTWGEEVAFLRRFLNERMTWMDVAFATPESYVAMCK
jgi:hypothetical protein